MIKRGIHTIVKDIYDKPSVNHVLNRLKHLPQLDSVDAMALKTLPPNRTLSYRLYNEMLQWNPNFGYYSKATTNTHFLPNSTFSDEFTSFHHRDLVGHFSPYVGDCVARYLMVEYKMNLYPYNDLVIFEIDGNDGTLMVNVLDYLYKYQRDVYDRCHYKVLPLRQPSKDISRLALKHPGRVEILDKKLFDWESMVYEPCFIIGNGVLHSLGHDMVRYDLTSGKPYQGMVAVNSDSVAEYYTDDLDYDVMEYLHSRGPIETFSPSILSKAYQLWHHDKLHPLQQLPLMRNWDTSYFEKKFNLSQPEFIPTQAFHLLHKLRHCFPNGKVVFLDYSEDLFPAAYSSPLLVKCMNDRDICSTDLLKDMNSYECIYPTNFKNLKDMFRDITGTVPHVMTFQDFWDKWMDPDQWGGLTKVPLDQRVLEKQAQGFSIICS